jgi:hypothetical protein
VIIYRATLDVPRELAWFVAKLLLTRSARDWRQQIMTERLADLSGLAAVAGPR